MRTFRELRRADVAYVGDKGANVGELTAAGLPVPDGFVVGAPAYAAFCAGGLRDRIAFRLASVDVDDAVALQSTAVELRTMIEAAPMPEEVAAAVRARMQRSRETIRRRRSLFAPLRRRRTPRPPPSRA